MQGSSWSPPVGIFTDPDSGMCPSELAPDRIDGQQKHAGGQGDQ